uniref:MADF domain-containing protein n=1 Tax=Anopheles christyi TaxID=43041 RepID=A0A182K6X1_9DIPT
MADLRLFSRNFITEFIELYKSFPCLWKVGSRDYSDRTKRELAYDALVAKYREVDRTAKRDEVKKKLYGLRSSYRREMAKLKNSIRTGVTLDDVYKPTLWYFYLFDFLSEHETLKEPTSTTDDSQDVMKEEEVEYCDQIEALEHGEEEHYDGNGSDADDFGRDVSGDENVAEGDDPFSSKTPPRYISQAPDRPESSVPPTFPRAHQSLPKKRKLPNEDRSERIEYLEPVETTDRLVAVQDDQYDVYGKLIAHKLRSFDRLQATFSQRLINEVLYEGEMGFLNRNCKIVDMGSPKGESPDHD